MPHPISDIASNFALYNRVYERSTVLHDKTANTIRVADGITAYNSLSVVKGAVEVTAVNANLIYAGPSSGATPANPVFRALVPADMGSLSGTAGYVLQDNGDGTSTWVIPPSSSSSIAVGTTPVTSGTVNRIFFEGTGNVVQQHSGFNYDASAGAAVIGGATVRGTRLTVVNSSDTATVQNIVLRNAADSADRLVILGNGNIRSTPSSTTFNASNELQYHIENTAGDNVGISFTGNGTKGFVYTNFADSAIKMGQVVAGVVQPVLSFRYNNDFRAATIRGNSGVSLAVGLTLVNVQPNREWGMLIGHTTNTILGSGGFGILDVTSGNYSVTVNGSTLNVGIGPILATARLHIRAGSATANTAPLKFTTGTVLTTAEAGAMEYNNTFHLTNSDATRRHVVTAPNTAKVTAGAPYANDGYITMNIGGTDFKIMTTA